MLIGDKVYCRIIGKGNVYANVVNIDNASGNVSLDNNVVIDSTGYPINTTQKFIWKLVEDAKIETDYGKELN